MRYRSLQTVIFQLLRFFFIVGCFSLLPCDPIEISRESLNHPWLAVANRQHFSLRLSLLTPDIAIRRETRDQKKKEAEDAKEKESNALKFSIFNIYMTR